MFVAITHTGPHQVSGTDEPFESAVDVATGVDKTFVLAATIEYLAQFGVRNFAVITHRNAILTKTVNNFTPGHPKSIVDRMTVTPTVITVDDLDTGAAQAAMDDEVAVKLYILSIQSLQAPPPMRVDAPTTSARSWARASTTGSSHSTAW